MTSNTPAFTPVQPRILQASRTSSNDDDRDLTDAWRTSSKHDRDLTKLTRIDTANSRSNPLTRRMLRRPDSDADHERYARHHCVAALERASFRIFVAEIPHDLGDLLGSVWIEYRSVTDSFPILELPDIVNGDVYTYVHSRAEVQRRMELKRDYYSISVLAATPTLPTHNQIRNGLAAFAVEEIRKTEPERDIVAQTTDSEDYDQVFPATEGWERVGEVMVLDSVMLHTLEEKHRSLRMFVNRGRK